MMARLRRDWVPLGIAGIACVALVVYAVRDPRRALVAFIAAYGWGVATVVAALVLLMILHLAGARWWLVYRPVFMAVAGTMPLFVPLFAPIGAAMGIIYPWRSPPPDLPEVVDEALQYQRQWQQPTWFLIRSAIYLASWAVVGVALRNGKAARRTSAIGLPVTAFTLTFAAFDWLMSLQPGWVSNMFGVYVFSSGLMSALAILAIATFLATQRAPDHAHAIGRLMLMSVILWTYIAFFQLMLVWIANLPHELTFYLARTKNGWGVVNWLLFGGRFVLPFFVLLSRPAKRSPAFLAASGCWLVVMSMLDFAWLTVPSLGFRPGLLEVAAFLFVGGLASAYAVFAYRRYGKKVGPAVSEPAVEQALRYRSP